MEPQYVKHADGKEYWRIPGSTFRGLFRAWMTKLAAKEECHVADSNARGEEFRKSQDGKSKNILNGEKLGRCFLPKEQWGTPDDPPKIECPIASLFGSLFAASRIDFSDAISIKEGANSYSEQTRMHVAVDRITGGAAESMLFDNTVLVAESWRDQPSFKPQIRINAPTDAEIRWLRKTIVALDLGLLRIGSSKSAGRLELRSSPTARGPYAEQLSSIKPKRNK
jgi:CRISPR/Cas system CSM-associated protein Csm3 (group 7 of RAMP superfamily)